MASAYVAGPSDDAVIQTERAETGLMQKDPNRPSGGTGPKAVIWHAGRWAGQGCGSVRGAAAYLAGAGWLSSPGGNACCGGCWPEGDRDRREGPRAGRCRVAGAAGGADRAQRGCGELDRAPGIYQRPAAAGHAAGKGCGLPVRGELGPGIGRCGRGHGGVQLAAPPDQARRLRQLGRPRRDRPAHRQWSAYLREVADAAQAEIVRGVVTGLGITGGDRWEVTLEAGDAITADGVVITGAGPAITVPGQPDDHCRVLDGRTYWLAAHELQRGHALSVCVIGSGRPPPRWSSTCYGGPASTPRSTS